MSDFVSQNIRVEMDLPYEYVSTRGVSAGYISFHVD